MPGRAARSGASRARARRAFAATPAIGFNRGVAVLGARVFFVTDNAQLLWLSRVNGALLWEVVLPEDQRWPYGGTMAPLVVGDLVIAGVSGGDEGIRGFLAAYHVATGRQAWRFWTVPARGEPAPRRGRAMPSPRAAERRGSPERTMPRRDAVLAHGQSVSRHRRQRARRRQPLHQLVVALDAKTGKLRWHYQFTPHDLHDWDAQEPPVLVDARFQGRDRKLLLQANRNGFFYVLDRTDGTLLLGDRS